jgi:hypothetical protein
LLHGAAGDHSREAVDVQETVLLQGTIAENIAMGRPDADFVDIERAVKAANLDQAIARLADGSKPSKAARRSCVYRTATCIPRTLPRERLAQLAASRGVE